jgi:hypothetical protein
MHLLSGPAQSRQLTSQQIQLSSEQLHQMHQFRQLQEHQLQQQQEQPVQLQQQLQQQHQKHQEEMQERQLSSKNDTAAQHLQQSSHGFDPTSSVLARQQQFLGTSHAMHDQHGVGNVAAAVAAAAAAAAALAPFSVPQAMAGATQHQHIPHQATHQHLTAHGQQALPVAPISSSGTPMLSLSNPSLSAAHITAGVLADPAASHMLNMGMIVTPSGLVPSSYFFPSSMALSQSGLQSSNSPSLWKPPSVPEVQMASAYRIGRYTPAERRIRLERYREKRTQRNYNRRVKYSCRKDIADKRHRVQGRFVKRETEAVLAAQEKHVAVGPNGQNIRITDGSRGNSIGEHALGVVGIGKMSAHVSGGAILTSGAAGSSSASSDPDFGNIGDDEETL